MTTLNRDNRAAALDQFYTVRGRMERLAQPLNAEDLTVQSMPDASPGKWHLAHTTWFFDTFLLAKARPNRPAPPPAFNVLFNSYYQSVGPHWARAARGALSRPTVAEVLAWREAVTEEIGALIQTAGAHAWEGLAPVLEVGLNHEEQHQELFCTDLRHALALNPMGPGAYVAPDVIPGADAAPLRFLEGPSGIVSMGADRDCGFAFDNEGPRHQAFLQPHSLGDRLVTNGEFAAFIRDGGYGTSSLWLAEGWALVQAENWRHPLYWRDLDGAWAEATLHGVLPLDPAAPVNGVSGFEAMAYATWAGARLPTEAEWEAATGGESAAQTMGLFTRPGLHPCPAGPDPAIRQRFGEVWQWTQSAYSPYPGYRAAAGALGEYNGKFMVNQLVLRGGSCVTPPGHSRISYRNFFPASARWQFSGVRLARDA